MGKRQRKSDRRRRTKLAISIQNAAVGFRRRDYPNLEVPLQCGQRPCEETPTWVIEMPNGKLGACDKHQPSMASWTGGKWKRCTS